MIFFVLLFELTLLYAALKDIKTHQIPNIVYMSLIIAGIGSIFFKFITLLEALISCIVFALILLIVTVFIKNIMGGGDIKIISLVAFSLGAIPTLLGIFIALVMVLAYQLVKRPKKGTAVPLAPFLFIGFSAVFLPQLFLW